MQQEKIRIIPSSIWKKHPWSEERSTCVSPRMRRKNAFTLIELLVVILIIGILVAIALPQYQKIPRKLLFQRMVLATQEIYKAQQLYYLENGRWANSFEELQMTPPSVTGNQRLTCSVNARTSDEARDAHCTIWLNNNANRPRTFADLYIKLNSSGKRYVSGQKVCATNKRTDHMAKPLCMELTGDQTGTYSWDQWQFTDYSQSN